MTFDISEKMVKIVRTMNGSFTLDGRPLTTEEVFSASGILPGIARRADQLSSLCLGYGIGATFEEVEGTPLGLKVNFDNSTPNVLRLLCLIDVVSELMKVKVGGATPLEQLRYD